MFTYTWSGDHQNTKDLWRRFLDNSSNKGDGFEDKRYFAIYCQYYKQKKKKTYIPVSFLIVTFCLVWTPIGLLWGAKTFYVPHLYSPRFSCLLCTCTHAAAFRIGPHAIRSTFLPSCFHLCNYTALLLWPATFIDITKSNCQQVYCFNRSQLTRQS